jgi:hypothetical protein
MLRIFQHVCCLPFIGVSISVRFIAALVSIFSPVVHHVFFSLPAFYPDVDKIMYLYLKLELYGPGI